MTKWEYKILLDVKPPMTIERLDALGTEGWELCAIVPFGNHNNYFYFKRPFNGT